MSWLLSRLAEPSTWGGIGLIVSQLAGFFAGGAPITAENGVVTALGIAAALIPEKKTAVVTPVTPVVPPTS